MYAAGNPKAKPSPAGQRDCSDRNQGAKNDLDVPHRAIGISSDQGGATLIIPPIVAGYCLELSRVATLSYHKTPDYTTFFGCLAVMEALRFSSAVSPHFCLKTTINRLCIEDVKD